MGVAGFSMSAPDRSANSPQIRSSCHWDVTKHDRGVEAERILDHEWTDESLGSSGLSQDAPNPNDKIPLMPEERSQPGAEKGGKHGQTPFLVVQERNSDHKKTADRGG